MKVAVISDIHGNLEAFREVLADIDKIGADSTICLGDLIGYGPNPEEVVQLLRSRSIPSIMGNHELALARADFLDWFNETARESLVLSEKLISVETRTGLGVWMPHWSSRRRFSFMAAPRIQSRNISSNGTMRAWKKFSARWTSRFVLSVTLIHWRLFRSLMPP